MAVQGGYRIARGEAGLRSRGTRDDSQDRDAGGCAPEPGIPGGRCQFYAKEGGVELASTAGYPGFGSTASCGPILGVVTGSPAAQAGLAAGDTITALNGHSVKSPSALRAAVDQFHPDQKLTVSWVDQYGNSYKAIMKLASGPTG